MEKKENIGHCHKTTGEERRKIVPKEVKNLKFILSNYSSVTKYSWEADGEKVSTAYNYLVHITE